MPDNDVSDRDHHEAMKNRKTMSTSNNWILSLVSDWMKMNDVNYICAPFKAE